MLLTSQNWPRKSWSRASAINGKSWLVIMLYYSRMAFFRRFFADPQGSSHPISNGTPKGRIARDCSPCSTGTAARCRTHADHAGCPRSDGLAAVGFILRPTLRYPLLRAAEKGCHVRGAARFLGHVRPVAPAVVAAGKRGAVSALVGWPAYPRQGGLCTQIWSRQCRAARASIPGRPARA
jgi:hypothetical protein